MIPLGKFSILKAYRKTPQGMYLQDEEQDEVLLPNKYIPGNLRVGDTIRVFVYTDSEDRMVATTAEPKMQLHEFAFLQVKAVTKFGAFLDWGLEKDLFVPFAEQAKKMEPGNRYLVFLYADEASDRLVASSKIRKFLNNQTLTVSVGEEVDLVIGRKTDLGVNVIINHQHSGLIFNSDLFQKVRLGDRLKGYIKTIREDNKIDIALEKQGYQKVEKNAQKILDRLKQQGGFLNLTDKSDPNVIRHELEMSKKTFKKALGSLYKQQLIDLEPGGVRLKK